MVFSSLLFLFRFLPIMLVVYYCTPRRFRNAVLFGGSLVFYAWGEPVYIVLILFSTLVAYCAGLRLSYSVRLRLRAFAGTVSGWAGREIYLRNFGGNQSLFSLVF